MALTQPEFANPNVVCTVNVADIDVNGDMSLGIQLTADQISTWSDGDLAAKILELKLALAAFLAPGQEIQINVDWMSEQTGCTLSEQYFVPHA